MTPYAPVEASNYLVREVGRQVVQFVCLRYQRTEGEEALVAADAEPHIRSRVWAIMQTPTVSTGTVVLLVEDEPLVRLLGADVLEDAGFEVIEATNADEAIALLKRHHDVRVLWTDVDMPGSLNGFEFARFVSQGWPEVAVLVTSGKMAPGPGDLPRHGAFIPKPYRPETVIQRIRELMTTA